MSAPLIELRNITKKYGSSDRDRIVVDDLTLIIEGGEFTSLMGPSGSGKTTLLNLMAGLDIPDQGTVSIGGTNLRSLADHRLAHLRLRRIGFVFQAFNLLPACSVLSNVEWPLEFAGHTRAEVRQRAFEALERVGVREHVARYPAELSGGEQQRVAIARAIATQPSMLLADEPTGNLDSQTGEAILELLRDLNRSEGVTVVMVTHDVFAATFGHRTVEVRDGRIVRDVRAPVGKTVGIASHRRDIGPLGQARVPTRTG